MVTLARWSFATTASSCGPGKRATRWVFDACQDPEIQYWIPIPRPYTRDDACAFVTGALGLGRYQFAVVEAGRVVGSMGLRVGKFETGHIGYWCASEVRGRGITTRALRRLCHFALDELGLERLDLTADVENFGLSGPFGGDTDVVFRGSAC